jgi:hypothetical protein
LVGGWNLEKAYWFWIFGDKSLTRIGLACDPGLDEAKLWFPTASTMTNFEDPIKLTKSVSSNKGLIKEPTIWGHSGFLHL